MKTLTLTMISASAVVFSGALVAGQLTVPNTFVSGDTVSSSEMNANFTAAKTAVDDNDTRITTNASGIATNAGNITTNTAGIASNAASISTNTTNITTNTAGIATNTGNISTLQTDVSALQASSSCQGQDASDLMVQVGPFCIDKYEASVWDTADGTGTQLGNGADDYVCADNGNDCTAGTANPIFARSQAGVNPSRLITWFQAQQACANVGKRLLTNAEWQMAAAGTPDDGTCNGTSGAIAATDANTGCDSTYGATNMVGNLWEWVADWIQGAGTPPAGVVSAGANFGDDSILDAGAANFDGTSQGSGQNFPAAVLRGGSFLDNAGIGVFAFASSHAPSASSNNFGFRCAR